MINLLSYAEKGADNRFILSSSLKVISGNFQDGGTFSRWRYVFKMAAPFAYVLEAELNILVDETYLSVILVKSGRVSLTQLSDDYHDSPYVTEVFA